MIICIIFTFNFVLFICYFIFLIFFKAKLSLDKAILHPTYECAVCGQEINCMKYCCLLRYSSGSVDSVGTC